MNKDMFSRIEAALNDAEQGVYDALGNVDAVKGTVYANTLAIVSQTINLIDELIATARVASETDIRVPSFAVNTMAAKADEVQTQLITMAMYSLYGPADLDDKSEEKLSEFLKNLDTLAKIHRSGLHEAADIFRGDK